MRNINYHFRLLNPIVWRPGGVVGRESGFGDISASVPEVAVYICVPEVCRIKEARYGDTRSARLTADQAAVLFCVLTGHMTSLYNGSFSNKEVWHGFMASARCEGPV